MKRILSSPFFLVAALAFLLPFFSVQCAGGTDLGELGIPGAEEADFPEVTGLDLVIGDAEAELETIAETPTLPELPGVETPLPEIPTPDVAQVDLGMVQVFAIIAAAVAVLGIFLSLFGGLAGGVVALILGVGGAVALFLSLTEFDNVVEESSQGLFEATQEIGFWLALGGFVIAGLTGLLRLVLPDRGAAPRPAMAGTTGFEAPPPAAPPPAAPPPAEQPPATLPPASPPAASPAEPEEPTEEQPPPAG